MKNAIDEIALRQRAEKVFLLYILKAFFFWGGGEWDMQSLVLFPHPAARERVINF